MKPTGDSPHLSLKTFCPFSVLPGINREEIVADFFKALQKIIDKSPECRNKCELIYFDGKVVYRTNRFSH